MNANCNTVSLKLVGGEQDNGLARLNDFSWICQTLHRCLRHVERCISENAASLDYRVVDLDCHSAFLAVEPIAQKRNECIARDTVAVFHSVVRNLESASSIDPRIDASALQSFRGFSSPLKRNSASLNVAGTEISSQFIASIDKLLASTISSLGSVSGALDTLDVHNKSSFVVYPPLGTSEVVCEFPDEMFDEVRTALKRNVTVYGLMHYAKGNPFPSKIEVDDFEIHPDDSDLPTLSDLYGVMADDSGGPSSTEIVRSLRNDY